MDPLGNTQQKSLRDEAKGLPKLRRPMPEPGFRDAGFGFRGLGFIGFIKFIGFIGLWV